MFLILRGEHDDVQPGTERDRERKLSTGIDQCNLFSVRREIYDLINLTTKFQSAIELNHIEIFMYTNVRFD